MSSLIATLKSELATELAHDVRRIKGGKHDSPLKVQARKRAEELKEAESKALDVLRSAADNRAESEYAIRVTRLKTLWSLMSANKRAIAACHEDGKKTAPILPGKEDECHALESDRVNMSNEIGVIYGLPIEAYDLEQNGRFMRAIRWHITVTQGKAFAGRSVGMLAMDDEDILMRGVELCYLDPENLVETIRFPHGGEPIKAMVPSIGQLYRNIKRAHGAEVNRFRKALAGYALETSLDALMEAGVNVEDGSYYDHYGYGYVDTESMPWAELASLAELPVSNRAALAESRKREVRAAERERAQRDADRVARLSAVTESPLPAGLSASARKTEKVYRAALKLVAAGMTIKELAGELGVTPATVTRNLEGLTVKASGLGYRSLVAA